MSAAPEYDVCLVGAGHNGLTAAFYLARAGLKTVVLERRDIVGGCCVTEEVDPENAPGCRASTTSYMASMLRPEVIHDLDLPRHGLKMKAADPSVQAVLPDGRLVSWWRDSERLQAELRRINPSDADSFVSFEARLKKVARYLQPFFLEPPPDIHASGLDGLKELVRVGRRVKGMRGNEISDLITLLSGSLGDLVDHYFRAEETKAMILANSLYGKHGGPYQPGTAVGLLFHLLSGGEQEQQGFCGHVMGGMGAITQAMAAACREQGVVIRTGCEIESIICDDGRALGVITSSGEVVDAKITVSNADPRRTFLNLVDQSELDNEFRRSVAAIKMNGPCAKVNFALSEAPKLAGMPTDADDLQQALFTLVPSYDSAEKCYDTAKRGRISEDLWVDCVLASAVDGSLAPEGRHMLTCFVQYVPYKLADGSWDEKREFLGDRVVKKIADYVPNLPASIIARRVYTPLDLERVFGITEGNIFHGDVNLGQLFFMRPLPGWAHYTTPIEGLYLCGAGTHPGGGVTGAPGYNAAHRIMKDRLH